MPIANDGDQGDGETRTVFGIRFRTKGKSVSLSVRMSVNRVKMRRK